MSKPKDLTSTEQLLDVIRGKKDAPGNEVGKEKSRYPVKPSVSVAQEKFDPRKTTVGISYDASGVFLVAAEWSGKHPRIVDYAQLEMDLADDADPSTLADHLVKNGYAHRFRLKKCSVWLLLRSEILEQWTIMVPKKVEGKEEAKAVYWAAKAKKKFDENASVFDYYRIDECSDKGLDKLRLGVFTVPRKQVFATRDRFAQSGLSLSGVSSFSLCCSPLLDKIPQGEDDAPIAVIRVDQEWSRIDLFLHRSLAFSRRIKTGVESLAVSIQERYRMQVPASEEAGEIELDPGMGEGLFEQPEVSLEEALAILNGQGAPVELDAPSVRLSDEEFMDLIEPAAQRLIRQIERTFDHFRTTMKVPAVKKILFVGQLARFETLVDYIGRQLSVETEILNPFAGPSMSTSLPVPVSAPAKAAYCSAVAAALANPQNTPNFLHNYRAKLLDSQLKNVHRILVGVFFGLLLGLGGYFVYNQHVLGTKHHEQELLAEKLSTYKDNVTDEGTKKLLAKLKKQYASLAGYTERFYPVAVFAEIAHLTPASVRINNVILNDSEGAGKGNFILDGFVVGKDMMLDSYLSNFMAMLEDSPLFTKPVIQKRNRVKIKSGEQILFVLNVQVI